MRLSNSPEKKNPLDTVETRFGPMTRRESYVYPHINNQQLINDNRAIQGGAIQVRTDISNIDAGVLSSTEMEVDGLLGRNKVVSIAKDDMASQSVQVEVADAVDKLLSAA